MDRKYIEAVLLFGLFSGIRVDAEGSNDSRALFEAPQVQLWQAKPDSAKVPTPSASSVATTKTLVAGGDFEASKVVKPGEFYLARPQQLNLAEQVFVPEEFKLGKKLQVSSPILTAIKRKNPLCLLNPYLVHLSW